MRQSVGDLMEIGVLELLMLSPLAGLPDRVCRGEVDALFQLYA